MERINNLLLFIDYLHSNIDTFKRYNQTVLNLIAIDKKRKGLKPEENWEDKFESDKLQDDFMAEFLVITTNITEPIHKKARELKIYINNDYYTLNNIHTSNIFHFTQNIKPEDIPVIMEYKKKYLDFREQVNSFFYNEQFFYDIIRLYNEFFLFFAGKEDRQKFESKKEKAKSIVDLILRKNAKQSLPLNELHKKAEEQEANNPDAKTPEQKQKKRKTLFHVITYILECHANKKPLPIGIKTTIEEHAKKRLNYTGKPNTFYKNFNEIVNKDFTNSFLKNSIGDNWQNVVLELAHDPETLNTYLEHHYK